MGMQPKKKLQEAPQVPLQDTYPPISRFWEDLQTYHWCFWPCGRSNTDARERWSGYARSVLFQNNDRLRAKVCQGRERLPCRIVCCDKFPTVSVRPSIHIIFRLRTNPLDNLCWEPRSKTSTLEVKASGLPIQIWIEAGKIKSKSWRSLRKSSHRHGFDIFDWILWELR